MAFSLNGSTLGVVRTDDAGVASVQNVSLAGVNAGTYPNPVAARFAGKTGSTISGNVARIVIVKTAPGYDSDPGHAGTGTVVAVWCP